jgi:hypothetical protein
MSFDDPAAYGRFNAEYYDAWVTSGVSAGTGPAVEFLRDIAGGGPALELGIGTGRIALPLLEAGVRVTGIDASEAMIGRLRAKPRGEEIPVAIGDFADVPVDGSFRLVYVVLNTFFGLLTQEAQVRCFRNVAAHLDDGGAFVIEAFVPDPTLFDRGQRVSATRVELERVQFDASRHDPVLQQVTSQHVLIGREGIVLLPVQIRYAWPSELDLMAQLAGLKLQARYADWERGAFTGTSSGHVSVYTH